MKKRLIKLLTVCAVCLGAGCAYAACVHFTGLAIPCFFHKVTGLLCPGCGVSRMCLALLRLDFAEAWQYNPMILLLLFPGTVLAGSMAVQYVTAGKVLLRKWQELLVWCFIVLLLIFGILRNFTQIFPPFPQ